jgi:hypothetical protein
MLKGTPQLRKHPACIKDSINLAEIRIFLAVFRFIQNSYVRQGYFTALGYL